MSVDRWKENNNQKRVKIQKHFFYASHVVQNQCTKPQDIRYFWYFAVIKLAPFISLKQDMHWQTQNVDLRSHYRKCNAQIEVRDHADEYK